jgi:hypothetical protein
MSFLNSSSEESSDDFAQLQESLNKAKSTIKKERSSKAQDFMLSQVTFNCNVHHNIERNNEKTNSAFDSDEDSSEYNYF